MTLVALNPLWAQFKAHLIRTLGHDGAAEWLRFAADMMAAEARKAAERDEARGAMQ